MLPETAEKLGLHDVHACLLPRVPRLQIGQPRSRASDQSAEDAFMAYDKEETEQARHQAR
jgi:hypothetical protein